MPLSIALPSLAIIFAAILAIAVPEVANGQTLPPPSRTVYKCQIGAKTIYSDEPCLGARKLEIEPTRGLDRYSGRQRTGPDVQRERRNELLAEAIRPLTGMTAKETEIYERRIRYSPEARRLCYRLDTAIPAAERAERTASPADVQEVLADLFALRSRYRDLRC